MMKQLIIFCLGLLVAFSSSAQPRFGNFEAVRLINGTEFAAGLRNGTIYYDVTANKFKFRQNGAWVELGSGGSGGVTDGDKGDITVTLSGATWTVDNGVISFPKMQSIAQNTVIGRILTGAGPPAELTATDINTMLPLFSTTAKGLAPLSPGGTTSYLRADGTWADPALSGTGTTETASNLLNKSGSDIRMGGAQTVATAMDLNADAAMEFSIEDPVTPKFGIIRGTGFGLNQGIHYVAGDYATKAAEYSRFTPQNHSLEFYHENAAGESVTFRVGAAGTGSLATFYTDNKTTKTGIQYAGTGYETQPTTLVTRGWVENAISAATSSAVPDGDKGDVTVKNGGLTWTIDNNAVTLAKIQDISGLRILGRSASTSGDPMQLTELDVRTMLSTFSTTAKGLAPVSPGGTTAFLRADGTWQAPPSGGSDAIFTSTTAGDVPPSGGGTGKYLRSDATWVTGTTVPSFSEGSYTPVAANLSLNASAVTPANAEYVRVGNKVTVSGGVYLDTTDGGVASFTLTLPIASNFTNGMQSSGTVVGWPADGYGTVSSDDTLDKASISIRPLDALNRLYYYHYTYKIQ